mmetsp:Transcript_10288/g.39982  ORF Transcript_10288/g.39982 Transcript_10288/m.39982 type:complete len:210 (-) Transcript_10288:910-1539(-)
MPLAANESCGRILGDVAGACRMSSPSTPAALPDGGPAGSSPGRLSAWPPASVVKSPRAKFDRPGAVAGLSWPCVAGPLWAGPLPCKLRGGDPNAAPAELPSGVVAPARGGSSAACASATPVAPSEPPARAGFPNGALATGAPPCGTLSWRGEAPPLGTTRSSDWTRSSIALCMRRRNRFFVQRDALESRAAVPTAVMTRTSSWMCAASR